MAYSPLKLHRFKMSCEAFPDASFMEMSVDYNSALQFWGNSRLAGSDDSRTGACAAKLLQHTAEVS